MPTYISLMSYTDKGIHAVRESPRRLDAAKTMLEEMGGLPGFLHDHRTT